ncbi:hypothetical protein CIB48_g8364, partial [Xylaria polymorpha]
MGNIKARIKATLLRRDSRRKSPSPSKNSCGRDYASSASTHTHPGYDASDEHSDDKVRGSNRSLSQERATSGSSLLNNTNNMNESNQPHNPTPDTAGDRDGDGDGDGDGDRPRNKSSQARPQAHHKDGDFQADGADSSKTPADPSAKPAPARTNSRAGSLTIPTTTSAIASPAAATATTAATSASLSDGPGTTALPSIHEHPATPPTVPSATPDPEVASPTHQASITNAEHHQDYIASPIDGNPHSLALLTPLAPSPSPSRPPLSPTFSRPPGLLRRQSILPAHQTNIVRALLSGPASDFELDPADLYHQDPLSGMVTRKIWVKRPLASATLITINEDDLVDDVREQILRKYANSLGRQFDAPDLALQICNREQQTSRPLQPDEPIARVIDSYYANGQSVDDALLINIPSRRTPKASPNPRFYADDRPHESGTDYFPPFHPPTYSHHSVATTLVSGAHAPHFPPSMSI